MGEGVLRDALGKMLWTGSGEGAGSRVPAPAWAQLCSLPCTLRQGLWPPSLTPPLATLHAALQPHSLPEVPASA